MRPVSKHRDIDQTDVVVTIRTCKFATGEIRPHPVRSAPNNLATQQNMPVDNIPCAEKLQDKLVIYTEVSILQRK